MTALVAVAMSIVWSAAPALTQAVPPAPSQVPRKRSTSDLFSGTA